jgi:hypothetical protein
MEKSKTKKPREKQKCIGCGKMKANGVILVGKKENYFVCFKCWRNKNVEEEIIFE